MLILSLKPRQEKQNNIEIAGFHRYEAHRKTVKTTALRGYRLIWEPYRSLEVGFFFQKGNFFRNSFFRGVLTPKQKPTAYYL